MPLLPVCHCNEQADITILGPSTVTFTSFSTETLAMLALQNHAAQIQDLLVTLNPSRFLKAQ